MAAPARSAQVALLSLLFASAAEISAAPALPSPARLSLEVRVEAQRSIERVYHSHRLGQALSLDEAVSRRTLVKRVRRYLAQSAALEAWGRPVTGEALQRELLRIGKTTRYPERLQEIFDALDRDPILIQECFVRQVLVERLTRNALLARRPGEDVAGAASPDSGGRDRPLTWEEWWETGPTRVVPEVVPTVAEPGVALPGAGTEGSPGALSCLPDDTWNNGILGNVPIARVGSAAVWTGSEMLVWGGEHGGPGYLFLRSGGRYDPLTDTWTSLAEAGAPSGRGYPAAVWTGSEMLVWGGCTGPGGYCTAVNSGGRYDPVTDSWAPMSAAGAPAPALRAAVVWTGSEMLVWGGTGDYWDHSPVGTGGRYDPSTDSWSPISQTGAPSARLSHSAVWTGNRMIVWGGFDGAAALDSGGLYDPANDTWSDVPLPGAPSPRRDHSVVWTGAEMIVWGGITETLALMDSGGRFDPASGAWSPTSTSSAPERRSRHGAAWTGSEMMVWGGMGEPAGFIPLASGARYDPAADAWSALSADNAPSERANPAMLWTGDLLVVWGGGYGGPPDDGVSGGGVYDPAADTWAAIAESELPWNAGSRTAVWSGSRMLIWGCDAIRPGYRYDPLVDDWSFMATLGEPSPRCYNHAVWTGTEMIVWGGTWDVEDPNQYVNSGGRYDPVADAWQPTSQVNAPSPRAFGTAVWTGTEMIVWGGLDDFFWTSPAFNDGGRYDPAADSWTATSVPGDLEDRHKHLAVWTGSEMIIWGGLQPEGDGWATLLGHGWRYDPLADGWARISDRFEPPWGAGHRAVWTGAEMLVWGGDNNAAVGQGWRYDPDRDRWSSMETAGAPSGRTGHFAAWTGAEMIVWGGTHYVEYQPSSWTPSYVNTGGRYDPASDAWTAMTVDHAPLGRSKPQAVWTGSEMIVWTQRRIGGGRYALGHANDDDGDGFSECDGDCNDGAATAWPGAPELCDTIDNDCDGSVDEDFDVDGDGWRTCAGDCDDLDPGAHRPPDDAGLMEAAPVPGGLRLTWQSQAATSGSGTVYDLFSGPILGLAASGGDFSTGTCLGEDLAGTTYDDLGPDPPAGEARFFILRAQNGCATGTWGSPGRDATAGAGPASCN